MRCKFCDTRLRKEEYEWDEERGEFVESGKHQDGACLDLLSVDARLDPTGYDYLSDFEE